MEDVKEPLVKGIEEDLEGFVDDTEVLVSSDEDFVAVDKCVARFERVSGAILNRSTKSVVFGFGAWKVRTSWPLSWLKTFTVHKVFGFILHHIFSAIPEKNLTDQLHKFCSTLFSLAPRVIGGLLQRAETVLFKGYRLHW